MIEMRVQTFREALTRVYADWVRTGLLEPIEHLSANGVVDFAWSPDEVRRLWARLGLDVGARVAGVGVIV